MVNIDGMENYKKKGKRPYKWITEKFEKEQSGTS